MHPIAIHILIFSGVSTGVPSKFIQDCHFHNYAMAHTYLVHSWYPVDPFERRLNIWGAGRDMDTSLKGRLKISSNRFYFDCFTLSDESMHECINLLNQFKPDLIIAYSDAIYEISKYAKQNNINVRHKNLSIQVQETYLTT